MDKIRGYFAESYNELVHNVTWPTWPQLVEQTIIVLIASIIFTLLVFIMNAVSSTVLQDFIYGVG